MTLITVKCPKGHVIIVADNYPEQYTKLICEKCKSSYPKINKTR